MLNTLVKLFTAELVVLVMLVIIFTAQLIMLGSFDAFVIGTVVVIMVGIGAYIIAKYSFGTGYTLY
jgi:hypothetical protein